MGKSISIGQEVGQHSGGLPTIGVVILKHPSYAAIRGWIEPEMWPSVKHLPFSDLVLACHDDVLRHRGRCVRLDLQGVGL